MKENQASVAVLVFAADRPLKIIVACINSTNVPESRPTLFSNSNAYAHMWKNSLHAGLTRILNLVKYTFDSAVSYSA